MILLGMAYHIWRDDHTRCYEVKVGEILWMESRPSRKI